jgi:hypothetical protein
MAGTDPVYATSIVDRKSGAQIQLSELVPSYANGYVTGASTATTTITGTAKLLSVGTGFATGVAASGFTVSTSGRITSSGATAKMYKVDAVATVRGVEGASQIYKLYIAKNGAIIPSSVSEVLLDDTVARSVSINTLVSLVAGDYVEVYIANAGASDSVTCSTLTMTVS